ncbi:MAG: hypothetical protein R3B70_36800 [Polyangiaceae bacterium]
MVARLVAAAALALLSSACTYRLQAPARDAALDDAETDTAAYAEPFGVSPGRHAPEEPLHTTATAAAPSAPRGGELGMVTGAPAPRETVEAEAAETEYEEVEATPGTPCYDAALKAGITSGTCTLISERRYLLVGDKDD